MTERSFQLTAQKAGAENRSGKTPGAATSIFKLVGSTLARDGSELASTLMGTQGVGWSGEEFSRVELETTKNWLLNRAVTIYGGTNEVQMNIISKTGSRPA
jgi:alkylation response protein AidB-like acyl-CoA dehydrogenase